MKNYKVNGNASRQNYEVMVVVNELNAIYTFELANVSEFELEKEIYNMVKAGIPIENIRIKELC